MEQLRKDIIDARLKNLTGRPEQDSAELRKLKSRFDAKRRLAALEELVRSAPKSPGAKALARLLDPQPFKIGYGSTERRETFLPLEIKGKLTAQQLTEAATKAGLQAKPAENKHFFTITHPEHTNFEIRARFLQGGKQAGKYLKMTRNSHESRSAPQRHGTSRGLAISHYGDQGPLTPQQRGHIVSFLRHVDNAAQPTVKPRRTK